MMATAGVSYKCGHIGTISRDTAAVLDAVIGYAETTLCWDCWLVERQPWHGWKYIADPKNDKYTTYTGIKRDK